MTLKICRSCLCECDKMKNILQVDLKLSDLDKDKFIDCYNAITDISLQDNGKSTMPTTICEKCENDFIFAYQFRLQCQRSDEELKLRCVKTEIEDIFLEPIVEINIESESSSESDQFPDQADSSDDSEEDDEDSEPSPTRPIRKSYKKTIPNKKEFKKKALHLSIQNCDAVGDIKAVFKCIHCDKVSDTYNGYVNHKKIHESWTPASSKCPVCEKDIERFFARHLISHKDYRPYKCLLCNCDYTNANALIRHLGYFIKKKPEVEEDHKCTVCPKTFGNLQLLTAHVAKYHIKCDDCDLLFENKILQRLHILEHNGKCLFRCAKCTHVYFCHDLWKRHNCGTDDSRNDVQNYCKIYSCQQCEKSYTIEKNLTAHALIAHAKLTKEERDQLALEFSCQLCSKSFATTKILKSHMLVHDTTTPRKKFCRKCRRRIHADLFEKHSNECNEQRGVVCTVCGKTLSRKDSLDDHMSIHNGHKPFSCNFCGKCFRQRTVMKNHIRTEHTHKNMFPYGCSVCDYGALRQQSVRGHMIRHHNIEWTKEINVTKYRAVKETESLSDLID